eukprot:TRINITY_DN10647_c0_g1_i1.p1 TRINITY_DN10647_c0_g1~~TRINITY_DN10647_c0_g1_i1.p1  ORF type:complete len:652 (+),score=91.73 TRINITY_DN10647_c0_g1_i1:18-1973(+)
MSSPKSKRARQDEPNTTTITTSTTITTTNTTMSIQRAAQTDGVMTLYTIFANQFCLELLLEYIFSELGDIHVGKYVVKEDDFAMANSTVEQSPYPNESKEEEEEEDDDNDNEGSPPQDHSYNDEPSHVSLRMEGQDEIMCDDVYRAHCKEKAVLLSTCRAFRTAILALENANKLTVESRYISGGLCEFTQFTLSQPLSSILSSFFLFSPPTSSLSSSSSSSSSSPSSLSPALCIRDLFRLLFRQYAETLHYYARLPYAPFGSFSLESITQLQIYNKNLQNNFFTMLSAFSSLRFLTVDRCSFKSYHDDSLSFSHPTLEYFHFFPKERLEFENFELPNLQTLETPPCFYQQLVSLCPLLKCLEVTTKEKDRRPFSAQATSNSVRYLSISSFIFQFDFAFPHLDHLVMSNCSLTWTDNFINLLQTQLRKLTLDANSYFINKRVPETILKINSVSLEEISIDIPYGSTNNFLRTIILDCDNLQDLSVHICDQSYENFKTAIVIRVDTRAPASSGLFVSCIVDNRSKEYYLKKKEEREKRDRQSRDKIEKSIQDGYIPQTVLDVTCNALLGVNIECARANISTGCMTIQDPLFRANHFYAQYATLKCEPGLLDRKGAPRRQVEPWKIFPGKEFSRNDHELGREWRKWKDFMQFFW